MTAGETTTDRLVTRPFAIVMAAVFAFFAQAGIAVPLVPRYVEGPLDAHEWAIGLTVAVFSIAGIVVRPAVSWVGSHHGRRTLMVGGSLVAAGAGLLAAMSHTVPELLAARSLAGAGEAFLFVGAATLAADYAPPHRRAESASYLSVALFGGIGVGPIIGEWVLDGTHYARGFVVGAAFALVAAAISLAVVEPQAGPAAAGERGAGGQRHRAFHPAALSPGIVLALGLAGFATFNAFMPEHALDVGLHGSSAVFAVYSVVCLVIRLVGAKVPERIGLARAVSAALGAMVLGLAIFAASPRPFGVYGGTVVFAVGISFLYPALLAMAVNSVDERDRVSVVSSFTMFFEVGNAAGGLAFGALAQATSKRGGFVGGAAACAIGLVVLWTVLVPHVRRSYDQEAALAPATS